MRRHTLVLVMPSSNGGGCCGVALGVHVCVPIHGM
jgi:hypothetical protein